MAIESNTIAEKDFWTNVRDAVTGNFAITHGTTAGNIVDITAPKVQLTDPQYQDLNGISMTQYNLRLLPNAGNDEIRILSR